MVNQPNNQSTNQPIEHTTKSNQKQTTSIDDDTLTTEFYQYFVSATPVTEFKGLNIGSRPASRAKVQGVEGLRAIPWIFAWTQVSRNSKRACVGVHVLQLGGKTAWLGTG